MNKIDKKTSLNAIWLKASVVGGLWAAVEIIIGSFFHNLRIPFAGSILAANSTVLMIAFYQMWPEKGLIWRAGLITALMKSISPSAVIFGPMTGIMSEALIIEMFLRIAGNNIISLSIAGALSVGSAFIHKIISLLILYGLDIAKLYVSIFNFAAKQLHVENAGPWDLVFALTSIYLILGIVSAITGIKIGKRSKDIISRNGSLTDYNPVFRKQGDIFPVNSGQHYSTILFFVHLIIVPLGLFIVNSNELPWATGFTVVYSLFSIIRYKGSLKRLRKPFFWLQLFILTFLATLFWNGFMSSGSFFDTQGLIIGLGMMNRAIFVVIAFSSIGIELRNPVIKEFLFKKGFRKIYYALELSFSALPAMIEALPKPGCFFRHPINSFSDMMVKAGIWLRVFEENIV